MYRALRSFIVLAVSITLGMMLTSPVSAQSLPNDNLAGAKPLTIGKAVRTKNVHLASLQANENDILSCTMYNSVWYRFVVPIYGSYNFSTVGSSMFNGAGDHAPDTKIAVYKLTGSEITFESLSERACGHSYGPGVPPAVITDLFLVEGETMYVRVGSEAPGTLGQPSSYRLKATLYNTNSLYTDGGFENNPLGVEWKLNKGGPQDGIVEIAPANGVKHFRFVGVPGGKKAKLSMIWRVPKKLKIPKDSVIHLGFRAAITGDVKIKAKLIISYKDGTSNTIAVTNIYKPGSVYEQYYMGAVTKSKKLASVKIQFIDSSKSGQVFIDSVSAGMTGEITRGALPLPAAPG